jgi:hypothetical protein
MSFWGELETNLDVKLAVLQISKFVYMIFIACHWIGMLFVCVCVCVCACMHACVFVCMYARMYVFMCLCVYVRMYVRMYVRSVLSYVLSPFDQILIKKVLNSTKLDQNDAVSGRNGCMQPLQDSERRRG